MKVYILYQTDAWNSHESERVLAICSTRQTANGTNEVKAYIRGYEKGIADAKARILEIINSEQ